MSTYGKHWQRVQDIRAELGGSIVNTGRREDAERDVARIVAMLNEWRNLEGKMADCDASTGEPIGERWCTCGIDEAPSIPDPRLSWRHKSFCAHGTEAIGQRSSTPAESK